MRGDLSRGGGCCDRVGIVGIVVVRRDVLNFLNTSHNDYIQASRPCLRGFCGVVGGSPVFTHN